MRLLLVTSVFPSPRRPTKGTFNRELVTALREAGDDVRVVVPLPWSDLLRAPRVACHDPYVTYRFWWYPPRIGHATHHHWMSRFVIPAARRTIRAWNPDLVLGYWAHPDGTVALAIARQVGVPGVLMVGGSDVQLLTRTPARRRIIVSTLQAADHVLAVGAALRDTVRELGVPANRVSAFARGVDPRQFHPRPPAAARMKLGLPSDRPIMLWVGRMAPVKGVDVLLQSWREVARHKARPLLLLIGDGEAKSALKRQAAGLQESVRFVGPVEHDAIADWYCAADLIVLPSLSEGVPNVLVEALACGTPFVASAVGGVPALVGDESVAVPPGNVAALTDALLARAAVTPMTRRVAAMTRDRDAATGELRAVLRTVIDAARQPLRGQVA